MIKHIYWIYILIIVNKCLIKKWLFHTDHEQIGTIERSLWCQSLVASATYMGTCLMYRVNISMNSLVFFTQSLLAVTYIAHCSQYS